MNANQTPAPVYISFATGSSNLFVEVFEFLSGSRERVLPCGISISMEAEVVGKRTKLFWWKATLGLFLCMSHLFCGRFVLLISMLLMMGLG